MEVRNGIAIYHSSKFSLFVRSAIANSINSALVRFFIHKIKSVKIIVITIFGICDIYWLNISTFNHIAMILILFYRSFMINKTKELKGT